MNLREAAEAALKAMSSFESGTNGLYEGEFAEEIAVLRAALAEPEGGGNLPPSLQEPKDFDHAIGADRFKVVRGAFWWHVLIGDSPTEHGKFRSRASAEKMAADLLREFRNGAFVQHETALAEPDLFHCPKCGGPADNGHDRSIPPSPYWCTKCMAEPVQERNFCSRCGKRTNDIHTCTPPAPLTDEVIAELWHQNGGFHHHFARAIERWLRGHA